MLRGILLRLTLIFSAVLFVLVIQDEDCLDDDDYLYGWATPWAGVSCHP